MASEIILIQTPTLVRGTNGERAFAIESGGGVGKVEIGTTGSFSVTPEDFLFYHLRIADNSVATITFPRPATDAAAYARFVGNPTASAKTITTGAGATVVLATLTAAVIEFDNTVGCIVRAAPVVYA